MRQKRAVEDAGIDAGRTSRFQNEERSRESKSGSIQDKPQRQKRPRPMGFEPFIPNQRKNSRAKDLEKRAWVEVEEKGTKGAEKRGVCSQIQSKCQQWIESNACLSACKQTMPPSWWGHRLVHDEGGSRNPGMIGWLHASRQNPPLHPAGKSPITRSHHCRARTPFTQTR